MNNNFGLYNSTYDDSDLHSLDAQQASAASNAPGPSNLGDMAQNPMSTMNPIPDDMGPQQTSQMDPRNIQQHAIQSQHDQSTMRRQSMPLQFPVSRDFIDPSVRRSSIADYGDSDASSAMNRYPFDMSQGPNLDPTMGGPLGDQMQLDSGKPSNPAGLSINTQYHDLLDFNGMAQNSNFQSPFEADMNSPFINSAGAMSLQMDMTMATDDMSGISSINDMFSAQTFGSPTFASSMVSSYGPIYGSTQHLGGPMSPNEAQVNSNEHAPQSGSSQSNIPPSTQSNSIDSSFTSRSAPNSDSQMSQTNSSSATSRPTTTSSTVKTKPGPAKVGDLSLPWHEPSDGWPSTMQGAKPHMEGPYRDAYAPSGFDLMQTLVRVHTRPNPQITIGAVDLSCAFVVCDARSHDNPIVYCSESFERLTGYSKYEIKGQNCRFLQSPDGKVEAGRPRKYCDDDSILHLKNCITGAIEAQISLINYRKGGQPFMNLLTMIPLLDDEGQLFQFVGFQVDLVENPHAISSRNTDGTYQMNYQRNPNFPAYQLSTPDPRSLMESGQSIPRDEVSTILATLGSGENELSRQMVDRMILENTDDVIHVLSLKGLFLYLSPSCGRVLEYKPAELNGTALSSVCHPSDIVPVTRELKEAQSGQPVSVVYRIRRKNSGYVWFESHGCLHHEQGKGRKCIILVGRTRPVYTLSKSIIMTAGGFGDYEIWSKMSTTGMFLYVSNTVKALLDRTPDELVGHNIQSIMRTDSKEEFDRIMTLVLTGQNAALRHEAINKRGQVLQARTWLYPGDASEGQKPTFVIGQTRLVKYSRGSNRLQGESDSRASSSIAGVSGSAMASHKTTSQGGSTPGSTVSGSKDGMVTTAGVVVSRAGAHATPLGQQDMSLASDQNAFEELKTTRSTSWQFELRQLEKRNRMLAEEVQQLVQAKKKRKRRRGAGLLQKDCANCHTTSTPEWRRGPSGQRDLCNSCGLRWAKQQGRVSPRTSPRHSLSNGSSKASNKASRSPQSAADQASAHNPSNSTTTIQRDQPAESPGNRDWRQAPGSLIPDKRSSPVEFNEEPIVSKAARTEQKGGSETHISRTGTTSIPSRIEEGDEGVQN